jgi:hypothetical protein
MCANGDMKRTGRPRPGSPWLFLPVEHEAIPPRETRTIYNDAQAAAGPRSGGSCLPADRFRQARRRELDWLSAYFTPGAPARARHSLT